MPKILFQELPQLRDSSSEKDVATKSNATSLHRTIKFSNVNKNKDNYSDQDEVNNSVQSYMSEQSSNTKKTLSGIEL